MKQAVLGLCPQFDVLYDDLSVEEHLLFYSRLRGVSASQEQQHVSDIIAEEIHLLPFIFLAYFLMCRLVWRVKFEDMPNP